MCISTGLLMVSFPGLPVWLMPTLLCTVYLCGTLIENLAKIKKKLLFQRLVYLVSEQSSHKDVKTTASLVVMKLASSKSCPDHLKLEQESWHTNLKSANVEVNSPQKRNNGEEKHNMGNTTHYARAKNDCQEGHCFNKWSKTATQKSLKALYKMSVHMVTKNYIFCCET